MSCFPDKQRPNFLRGWALLLQLFHLLELLPICWVVEGAHDKSKPFFVAVEGPHRVCATSSPGVATLATAAAQVYAVVSAPVAAGGGGLKGDCYYTIGLGTAVGID